ncbi:MAG: hypothetical protein IJY08_01490 [Clostridia bacterium]|nr:hypothetical protein [Clostridia bacterium]
MKKTLTLIISIIICISICFCISVSANSNPIIIENTEVFFEETCNLSNDAKQQIAEEIVYGSPSVSTYGLSCTIFGHDCTIELVTTITHYAQNTYPKCLQETWEVETCTKCGESITQTRVNYKYIDCCL